MIETLTFICIGFLFLFGVALLCCILFFLFTEIEIIPILLVLSFWSFFAYHVGKVLLTLL